MGGHRGRPAAVPVEEGFVLDRGCVKDLVNATLDKAFSHSSATAITAAPNVPAKLYTMKL